MNIYKNPPLIVRYTIIIIGLLMCLIAGHAQSILFLGIGLAVSIFGIAIGDKEYLSTLFSLLIKVKNSILDIIFKR